MQAFRTAPVNDDAFCPLKIAMNKRMKARLWSMFTQEVHSRVVVTKYSYIGDAFLEGI